MTSGLPATTDPIAWYRRLAAALWRVVGTVGHGVVDFVEGFRGRSWDAAAEAWIQDELRAFRQLWASEPDQQLLEPRIDALMTSRRQLLRWQLAVRAVTNRLAGALFVAAVVVPPVVVALTSSDHDVWTYLFSLLGVAWLALLPAKALWVLTGRPGAALVWVALLLSLYVAGGAMVVSRPGPVPPGDGMAVAAAAAVAGFAVVLLGRSYLLAWNAAALRRAWVEERLEASVVVQLLAVLDHLESTVRPPGTATDGHLARSDEPPVVDRPLEVTGQVRALLNSAAAAVRDHLPGLIEASAPPSAQARAIADEVAGFLLDLQSAGDLPDGRAPDGELQRVRDAIRGWSTGSLGNLPRADADGITASTARSRWSTASQMVRTILLGLTPLILLVAISLSPITIPRVVSDSLGPFAVTWLLVCIAYVFHPGDHTPDLKTLLGR
jgi:hypothetical protein